MRWLLYLYPREWRRRYGAEFGALLEQQQASPRLILDVVLGALDARWRPQGAESQSSKGEARMAWLRYPAQLALIVAVLGSVALGGAWLTQRASQAWQPIASSEQERAYLVLQADLTAVPAGDRDARLQDVVQTTERRLQAAGVGDVTIQLVGTDRVLVTVPAGSDLALLAYLTTERGRLDFREQMALPDGTRAWVVAQVRSADGEERALTSQHLSQATPSADPTTNRPLVLFELNPEGRQMLAALTQRLMGQRLGIFVDDQLYVALTVRDPILEGRGQITGQFTPDDARNLAIRLSAGALPVPLQLVEAATS